MKLPVNIVDVTFWSLELSLSLYLWKIMTIMRYVYQTEKYVFNFVIFPFSWILLALRGQIRVQVNILSNLLSSLQ